jgi:hypothetical protein
MNRFRRIMYGTAMVGLMLASSGCPWWHRGDNRGGDNRSDRYDRDRDRDQDRDRDRDRDRDGDRDRGDPRRDR